MTDTDNHPVEQLWYTWSDIGVGTIHTGFHVRAASPGLTEIYGDRVRSMDRYMRYALPPGTDRSAITPAMAPVGLAFVRSEWNDEYILVHKNYLGKDSVGRSGNFFVHALALGENRDFSAEEAIWQWEAAIWKTSDSDLDRRNTRLNPLSMQDLDNTTTRFHSKQFRSVRFALQFVIEAYLMRKDRGIPIYIAAPADQAAKIAAIIAGLTNCLPAKLLAGLTFSTYEPDITKASTEIVGMSWIPTPGKEQEAATIFSKSMYREKLLINCATREKSALQNHPQITYNQLAADFAAYAAECLTTENVDQLYALCDDAEKSNSLDVPLFLQLYNIELSTADTSEAEIEQYLASDLRIQWLTRRNSRKKIIDRALANPQWSANRLFTILLKLREQAERKPSAGRRVRASLPSEEPEQVSDASSPEVQPRRGEHTGSAQATRMQSALADALALLAQSMIPEAVQRMEQADSLPADSDKHKQSVYEVRVLLSLINACVLPQDPTEVWKQLFEAIEGSKRAITFLQSEWTIYAGLLGVWHNIFLPKSQGDDRMRPLLHIPWSRLGEFLRLGLQVRHVEWIVFAVEELVADPATLTQAIAKELEQNYAQEIGQLLNAMMQGQYLKPEADLITRLVEKGYTIKLMQQQIEQLLDILSREGPLQHTAKELVTALAYADYTGTERYQRSLVALMRSLLTTAPKTGLELATVLIECNVPRSWLVDLLLMVHTEHTNLLDVIQYVYPQPEMQNEFFLQNGARYLKRQGHVQFLLNLYQQLLPLEGRLQRLTILLDSITDTRQISDLFAMVPLDANELESVLKRYGRRYLQSFQQSPQLASIVVTSFTELINTGYTHGSDLLFTILSPRVDISYLEEMLAVAKLNPEQQARFLEHYGSAYLARYVQYTQPSVLMSYITSYIGNVNSDALEEKDVKPFFAALVQHSAQLPLDNTSKTRILCWQVVQAYLNAPDAQPQTLQRLANALPFLPDDPNLKTKLTQAFFSCIQTSSDVSEIVKSMREVPKIAKEKAGEYELLDKLAEQAVEDYESQHNISMLAPYLLFALTMPPQERTEDFFQQFLGKLLQGIHESEVSNWTALNIFVEQQRLPDAAIARWRTYYRKQTNPFFTGTDDPITKMLKAFRRRPKN